MGACGSSRAHGLAPAGLGVNVSCIRDPVKVLVVDDDPRLREALELGILLQWEDAEVVTAVDGEEGLQRFVEHEPDVVLLDVTMPRMNGLEVLRLIRRVSDVPIIM